MHLCRLYETSLEERGKERCIGFCESVKILKRSLDNIYKVKIQIRKILSSLYLFSLSVDKTSSFYMFQVIAS